MMHPRLIAFLDEVRSSYWFVPALLTLGATALALTLTALDNMLTNEAIAGLAWVYGGGPEGARALLSTVAGSVITVAGTTFSVTIAALTLASSQFGPRLLRTFLRNAGNQIVLGTFIATFLYCLIVLRTIRDTEDGRFVPHISVTGGVLLAVASVGMLIYFIHHVASSMQADSVITAVSHELDETIDRLFPEPIGHEPAEAANREESASEGLAGASAIVALDESGYLQMIDAQRIISLASEHDLLLQLTRQPGDFIIAGSPLAQIWHREQLSDDWRDAIAASFVVGDMRTKSQDVRFAINQLVEIAVRALSPGVNDPFTALTCVERLVAALCVLADRSMPSGRRYDDCGRLRVIVPVTSYATLVELAFDPIVHYGRGDPLVLRHLLAATRTIGAYARNAPETAALYRLVAKIRQASVQLPSDPDRDDIEVEARSATALLASVVDGTGSDSLHEGAPQRITDRRP